MANLNRTKFFELIDKSNIKEYDKLSIKAAVDYFDSDKNKELESRSYLFKGDTGVGKTFIAEKLVEEINQEILYMGTGESLNYRKFDSMSELIENIEKRKNQVIYIDDLNFILSKGDYGAIESEDLRNLMRILDIVKKQENKILIITLNDITDFCEQIIDRVEIKIEFDLPTNENKKDFLKQKFSKYLSESKINTLTYKSIGYNYRDLGELIKLAYRIDKKLSLNSLNQALEIYKPTQLYDYEIINSDVKLNDLIGNEDAVQAIKQIGLIYKHESLTNKFKIKRSNLLLFEGPAGTGKSFAAKALAGYLGYPILNISAADIYSRGMWGTKRIFNLAKRYKHCIIFIDEADKLIGKDPFGEDTVMLGDLQRQIEGASKERIESIFILSANDINRFGSAFRSRFKEISFKLPEQKERLLFCNKHICRLQKDLPLSIDAEELASKTKGMSYRDLEVLWEKITLNYLENRQPITNETISSMFKTKPKNATNEMFG